MSRNLDAEVADAASVLSSAGCSPLARVRAAAGVMDMVFFTAAGACLLVRCSTKKSPAADLEALATIHFQRTFDHVILLCDRSEERPSPPSIISFTELSARASTLAELQPGWSI